MEALDDQLNEGYAELEKMKMQQNKFRSEEYHRVSNMNDMKLRLQNLREKEYSRMPSSSYVIGSHFNEEK